MKKIFFEGSGRRCYRLVASLSLGFLIAEASFSGTVTSGLSLKPFYYEGKTKKEFLSNITDINSPKVQEVTLPNKASCDVGVRVDNKSDFPIIASFSRREAQPTFVVSPGGKVDLDYETDIVSNDHKRVTIFSEDMVQQIAESQFTSGQAAYRKDNPNNEKNCMNVVVAALDFDKDEYNKRRKQVKSYDVVDCFRDSMRMVDRDGAQSPPVSRRPASPSAPGAAPDAAPGAAPDAAPGAAPGASAGASRPLKRKMNPYGCAVATSQHSSTLKTETVSDPFVKLYHTDKALKAMADQNLVSVVSAVIKLRYSTKGNALPFKANEKAAFRKVPIEFKDYLKTHS